MNNINIIKFKNDYIPFGKTGLCLAIDGPYYKYYAFLWITFWKKGVYDKKLPPKNTAYY